MKKKEYRIELFEEMFGCWRFEVWDGDVCIFSPGIGMPNNKMGVRSSGISFAERQKDYGSHVVNEHYQLV